MNKMTADQKMNLLILRDFITSINPSNFDMGTYCDVEPDNDIVEELLESYYVSEDERTLEGRIMLTPKLFKKLSEKTNPHTCGTHMCLMGWSYSVPTLQKKLSEETYVSWSDVSEELFGTNDSEGVGRYLFSVDWEHGGTLEGESTNTVEHAIYRINRVLAAVTDEDYEALRKDYIDLT